MVENPAEVPTFGDFSSRIIRLTFYHIHCAYLFRGLAPMLASVVVLKAQYQTVVFGDSIMLVKLCGLLKWRSHS